MKKLLTVIIGHVAFFLCAVVILFLFGSLKLATYQNQVIFHIAACMTAAALIMTVICTICGRKKKKLPEEAPVVKAAAQEHGAEASDGKQP